MKGKKIKAYKFYAMKCMNRNPFVIAKLAKETIHTTLYENLLNIY